MCLATIRVNLWAFSESLSNLNHSLAFQKIGTIFIGRQISPISICNFVCQNVFIFSLPNSRITAYLSWISSCFFPANVYLVTVVKKFREFPPRDDSARRIPVCISVVNFKAAVPGRNWALGVSVLVSRGLLSRGLLSQGLLSQGLLSQGLLSQDLLFRPLLSPLLTSLRFRRVSERLRFVRVLTFSRLIWVPPARCF